MGVNLIADDSDDMERVPSVTSVSKLFAIPFQYT